jgi:hypothetical protein
MPMLSKGRKIGTVLVAAGAVGILTVVFFSCYLKPAPETHLPSAPEHPDTQSEDTLDAEELSPGEQVSLGRLLGTNNPAVPPVNMRVGPEPGEANAPDFSTPAAAVYSVLSLIDQDATDKLAGCFVGEAADMEGDLYPRYLGLPVELADVFQDGESAVVIWNATVHTAFSLDGRNWSAGEKMTLTTRLRKVEDLWKLLRLHEGVKDDSQ